MKRFTALLLSLALLVCIAGCSCKHEFSEASCVLPQTCKNCGETKGEALGHQWSDATLMSPKTCGVCNETEGNSLFHQCESWEEVFQQSFDDEFDFLVADGDLYQLAFANVEDLSGFMLDAMYACLVIGIHHVVCDATTVTFTLEDECMVICFVPESASIPKTMFIVLEGASKGDEMQALYDLYFAGLDMDAGNLLYND